MVADRSHVMPGFMPGIHDLTVERSPKTWMAGTEPGHDVIASKRRGYLLFLISDPMMGFETDWAAENGGEI